MSIRDRLLASTLLVVLPLGCSESTMQTPVAPPKSNVPPPVQTDKGVSVTKKHTLPTANDPGFVAPGP